MRVASDHGDPPGEATTRPLLLRNQKHTWKERRPWGAKGCLIDTQTQRPKTDRMSLNGLFELKDLRIAFRVGDRFEFSHVGS